MLCTCQSLLFMNALGVPLLINFVVDMAIVLVFLKVQHVPFPNGSFKNKQTNMKENRICFILVYDLWVLWSHLFPSCPFPSQSSWIKSLVLHTALATVDTIKKCLVQVLSFFLNVQVRVLGKED